MKPLTKEQQTLVLVNIALITAQIGFGGFNVVGKYALQNIHPIIFAFYREVLAGPLLLIIAAILERVKPKADAWPRLIILGCITCSSQLCFIFGLKLTESASQTAIMQQCIPVFTAALTVILKMEKFSLIKLSGLIFAVLGAMIMIGFKDFSLRNNHTIGMVLLIVQTLLISVSYIVQKPILAKYPPITVTGWSYIVASVLMGLVSLYYINEPSAFDVSRPVWWPLAYAVGVQTILGYCLITWANKNAAASIVAIYSCVQPIVAFVLASIFFEEVLEWNDGVGMVSVIIGLLLVIWTRAQEKSEEERKERISLIVNTEKEQEPV